MFRIEMLPAEQGDALFIEYGSARSPHRVLIDAGVRKTSGLVKERIGELPASKRHFDLLIVTHVDSDHIGGIPKLLADTSLGVTFDDVWFNGWRHLQPDRLGPVEGEIFSAQLDKRNWDWNAAFDEKAVVVRPRGRLPKRELPGGMTLTLLSPTRHRLEVLRDEWKKVVEEAGLEAGVQDENLAAAAARRGIPDLLGDRLDVEELAAVRLLPDKAPANGSTIAVLAEFDGRELPAHRRRASRCLRGRARAALQGPKEVSTSRSTALKVPHHGSRFNVSKAALDLIETDRYLFSTNGNQTEHPHLEGVARTIVRGGEPTLYFNYRSEFTVPWDDRRLQREARVPRGLSGGGNERPRRRPLVPPNTVVEIDTSHGLARAHLRRVPEPRAALVLATGPLEESKRRMSRLRHMQGRPRALRSRWSSSRTGLQAEGLQQVRPSSTPPGSPSSSDFAPASSPDCRSSSAVVPSAPAWPAGPRTRQAPSPSSAWPSRSRRRNAPASPRRAGFPSSTRCGCPRSSSRASATASASRRRAPLARL